MADNEGLRVTGEAIVLSITPDVCRTPPTMAPVPYQILGRFSDGIRHATSVCMTGEAVMTMHSRLTTVYGDEAGVGGGVISGVNKGYCKPVTHSTTVTVEGHHVTYHTSIYEMNCDGPDGVGNTLGRVVFVENVNSVRIGPLGEIEGETSPTPEPETKEEESWWEKGLSAVHTTLDVVGLIPGLGEIADGANAVIHGVEAAAYAIAGNEAKAAENALMATLSVAAMLPIGGQAATAGKFAIKIGKEIAEAAGEKIAKEGVEAVGEKVAKEGVEAAGEKATKEAAEGAVDGAKVTSKPRKPNQPNRKKWVDKGGEVIEHPDGSVTYRDKDGIEVTYNPEGYPDFSPYRHPEVKDVEIEMKGYPKDFDAANEKAGLPETPDGYTWHHHEDGKTMQLIESDVHNERGFSHTGGMSTTKRK